MTRFLVNLILGELAVLGAVLSLGYVLNFANSAYWYYEAQANEFERNRCETKHMQLLKQIRNEGLWGRLGLAAQPHLGERG